MNRKRILIVHPYDRTTFFLRRIKNELNISFSTNVHYFSVKPSDDSHFECLKRIAVHDKAGLIIFLGHGRSDRLYGSKSDDYDSLISEDAKVDSPEKYYFNDNFINESNAAVFKDKKVVCLACNSNEKIAQYALNEGAVTFLGFGNIPTSSAEFQQEGVIVSPEVVNTMKATINYIVKKSLSYTIKRNGTMEDLMNMIKFLSSKSIAVQLVEKKKFKERIVLADYLYYFKRDTQVLGTKKIKLIE